MEYTFSKLFSHNIGVGVKTDTNYEIMNWKTAKNNEEYYFGINYFQNSYFIANLNSRRVDTFPIPCFLIDIEQVFVNKRDRMIISKFLTKENIDEILQYKDPDITFKISKDDYFNFLDF